MQSDVHFFNPTCELAVANGSFSYVPPLLLQEMERDLSALPHVFCKTSDFVITENPPSPEFFQKLNEAGFQPPKFARQAELENLQSLNFYAIYPWGWSPAAHFKLRNLKEKCSPRFLSSMVSDWKTEHNALYNRKTSLQFLHEFLENYPSTWFIEQNMTGKQVASTEEIELLLSQYHALVLKAPVSSSGRGIQFIRKSNLDETKKQWIRGILKQQDFLIAEPFLDKYADLSFQFEVVSNHEINFKGFTLFETNTNGQYQGTLINPDLMKIFRGESEILDKMIRETSVLLLIALRSSVFSQIYEGFLGIDAMIFRKDGRLMMQPCLEINCRRNMGILTQFIEGKIYPGIFGRFKLFYGRRGEFYNFCEEQSMHHPLRMEDGKLCSGFVPLVEPNPISKFGAYLFLGSAK